MKHLYFLQTIILLGGTIFAWTTVAQEALPNPWMTVCIYGALGFTIAFLWAGYVHFTKDAKLKDFCQKYLVWFLVAGTLFAWGSFVHTAWSFFNRQACTLGCPEITTLWAASCLWGALTFSLALVVALVVRLRSKK